MEERQGNDPQMVLQETQEESPDPGEQQQQPMVRPMSLSVRRPTLTGAVLSIARETAEAEAGMAPNRVDTPGKIAALLLPRRTLIHI